MRVNVYLLRKAGRKLRDRDVMGTPPLNGALTMYSIAYKRHGTVNVLQLTAWSNQTEAGNLATLYEPVLTNIGHNVMVFRGIERWRLEDGTAGYAQEWRCELSGG